MLNNLKLYDIDRKRRNILYINTEFGSLFRGACAIWQGFDPYNMFPHGRFRQSARKGYVNYVPAPVRLEFNEERICSREYVLADIFDLPLNLL